MKQPLDQQVCAVAAQTLHLESAVTPSLKAGDIPQWDSLGHMLLVAALEDAFTVKFTPEQMFRMESVQDMIDVLRETRHDL